MTARQAANGQCTIVRRRPESHPAGPANALRMSAYVRSVLHELAARTGMPHHRLRYGMSVELINSFPFSYFSLTSEMWSVSADSFCRV